MPRTCLRLAVLLLLTPPFAEAQELESEFRWNPPMARKLRDFVDAVDQARSDGDVRGITNGLTRIAESLLDGVPPGGFSISPHRWVGPGAYLTEILRLLPEQQRQRVNESIDLIRHFLAHPETT